MNLNSIFFCRFQEELRRCQYIISCSARGAHHLHTHARTPTLPELGASSSDDNVIKITPLETMESRRRCDVYQHLLFYWTLVKQFKTRTALIYTAICRDNLPWNLSAPTTFNNLQSTANRAATLITR
jgi:hypothetical protein